MNCAEAQSFIHAFVDGELGNPDQQQLERHIADCTACASAVRLQGRWKAAIRGLLPPRPLPPALRLRIDTTLATLPETPGEPRRALRTAGPAAFAAVLVIVLFAARQRSSVMLDQAIRTYNAAMPLDVVGSDCASIANWFRGKLDFNVQAPHLDGGSRKVACQGGRLVNVRDRLGAYLVYQAHDGHRLTMLVFDVEDELPSAMQHKQVAGRDVYFASRRGASLAAYRDRDGLSYIMTSDFDQPALQNVVEAMFQQAP